GDDREFSGDEKSVGEDQRRHGAHAPQDRHHRILEWRNGEMGKRGNGKTKNGVQAFRLLKKCASTKSSTQLCEAGSTESNAVPIPTGRSPRATCPSASMWRFDPGMRKRTLTFAPASSGLVVRMAMPP